MADQLHGLFTAIVELYKDAANVHGYGEERVFRGRQHTISSKVEDLFARLMYRHLKDSFPGVPFCCMVDYPIRAKQQIMYPDIAVIIENPDPIMVSYIDLKMDFGYKRDYYTQFSYLSDKIKLLRTEKNTGTLNSKNKLVSVVSGLKMRTVAISECNMHGDKVKCLKEKVVEHSEFHDLYFLSRGAHPNEKKPAQIIVDRQQGTQFLQDIRADFCQGLQYTNT